MTFTLLNINLILNFTQKKKIHPDGQQNYQSFPTLELYGMPVGEQFKCDSSSMSVYMKGHTDTVGSSLMV
jgi:hypothetical protein